MSATLALLVVLVGWLAIGVAAGLVMGRRGHDPFGWLLLGAMAGPLVLPLALASERHPVGTAPRRLVAGRQAGGRVDVLVGIDGSPQAAADLDATVTHQQEEARLREELAWQASQIQARLDAAGVPAAAELVLLRGRPAQALAAGALLSVIGELEWPLDGQGWWPGQTTCMRVSLRVAVSNSSGVVSPRTLCSRVPLYQAMYATVARLLGFHGLHDGHPPRGGTQDRDVRQSGSGPGLPLACL